MTAPDGIERRKRLSAGEVAESLARHEKECAERYGVILTEIRGMRSDVTPILEVYRASTMGGRALMKLVAFVGAVSAIVFGWLKVKTG